MSARPRTTARRIVAALAATAATGAAALAAAPATTAAADGAPGYVALGDSYTSAPLVLPIAAGSPLDCGRSARNYPHLTAQALGFSLTDVSCGGAQTSNLTTAQYSDAPAQDDALSAGTRVVTLGMGGNDNNTFITAVAGCGVLDAADGLNIGSPCKSVFGSTFTDDINADGPVIGAALQHIHQLAPNAQVYVVGYPDILPQSGGCWPQMPMTTGDVAYLNGVEENLDAMLKAEAQANGATFVDTFTQSIGHDACKPEGTRWVEPVVPSTDAISVHPNAAGEAEMAAAVEAAIKG